MSRIAEYREELDELYRRTRLVRYYANKDLFALIYEAADTEAREEADEYIAELNVERLKQWLAEQRWSVWAGWSLKELREYASDQHVRNCRNMSREQLIREIGLEPAEAQAKARRKDPDGDQSIP
jgi:hypothetical protein